MTNFTLTFIFSISLCCSTPACCLSPSHCHVYFNFYPHVDFFNQIFTFIHLTTITLTFISTTKYHSHFHFQHFPVLQQTSVLPKPISFTNTARFEIILTSYKLDSNSSHNMTFAQCQYGLCFLTF